MEMWYFSWYAQDKPSQLAKKDQMSKNMFQIEASSNAGIFGLQGGAQCIKLISVKDSQPI